MGVGDERRFVTFNMTSFVVFAAMHSFDADETILVQQVVGIVGVVGFLDHNSHSYSVSLCLCRNLNHNELDFGFDFLL